jgi:hypothetical protein
VKRRGGPVVAFRVTCATCGDKRKVGEIGYETSPGADREPYMAGRTTGHVSAITFHCRDGHNMPARLDRLLPVLATWRDEVGVGGQRAEDLAL